MGKYLCVCVRVCVKAYKDQEEMNLKIHPGQEFRGVNSTVELFVNESHVKSVSR